MNRTEKYFKYWGTIGKVALIDDEDLQGIFADFTMRIRLASYRPLFAYYYFRTDYFIPHPLRG